MSGRDDSMCPCGHGDWWHANKQGVCLFNGPQSSDGCPTECQENRSRNAVAFRDALSDEATDPASRDNWPESTHEQGS